MADEKIEEITPGGGGNPLIPAIAVLVLMPVISFVLMKIVFIPQIQSAVTAAVTAGVGGEGMIDHSGGDGHGGGDDGHGGDAHGGGHGGDDGHGGGHGGDDGHGGGHGGDDGHGGGGGDAAAPSGNTYEFEGIIANLSGSSINRYVRVSFIIEGENNSFAGIIDKNRVKLIDATITVLSGLTSLDLQNAGVKNHVRSKLISSYDAVLKSRMVDGLYFSEFVVQ